MESEHESESNEHLRKDANDSRNKDDAVSPIISVKKSYHDSESGAEKDINFNEETSDLAENSKSSHSSAASSSSSESSSDFFQIDTKIPQKSSTFPEDSQSPEKREKNDALGDMSCNFEDPGQNSSFDPRSQVSHAINESNLQIQSLVQSPPTQVMEKTGGYDPDRIPDSVFGRSSSAVDWSVASNESLFSLHLGNNSFSREQFLLMYESGELNRTNETVKPGRPPLSPVGKLQAMDSDKKPEQTLAEDETIEDSLKLDTSNQLDDMETDVQVNGRSSMIDRSSDASGTSTQSFAFPILVDTTKNDSLKGPSPRQQGPKQAVYEEETSPQLKAQTKSSSSHWGCCCCYNFCSLPQCSCPSYQHCWSWKWCKKWFSCSYC